MSTKVALCLYGQPRFIDNPLAFNSIKKHILDVYDTDVFCHFWFDKEKKLYERSDFSKAPNGCPSNYKPYILGNTIELITDFFHPISYACESPRDFPKPSESLMPKVFLDYPSERDKNISNMISQLYSWQKVLELFNIKKNPDIQYDWVIIARYDNIILDFPSLNGRPKKGVSYTYSTADIIITETRFCDKLKPYDKFDQILPSVNWFDAAEFKRAAIGMTGSGIADINECLDLSFSLVRTHKDIKIHNISDFTGGWFIGQFDPSILKTDQFEVCLKEHKKDEKWPVHFHKIATEYNLLVKGKMLINNKEINPGEIFVLGPYQIADPVFLEDCQVIIVKVPSVPGDKFCI